MSKKFSDVEYPIVNHRFYQDDDSSLWRRELNVPEEMFHFLKVVEMGAKKYAMNNWLEADGKKCSEKEMHDSMFHHLAESFTQAKQAIAEKRKGFSHHPPLDEESHLDPLLHLACRALMLYTRRQRGIVHKEDK